MLLLHCTRPKKRPSSHLDSSQRVLFANACVNYGGGSRSMLHVTICHCSSFGLLVWSARLFVCSSVRLLVCSSARLSSARLSSVSLLLFVCSSGVTQSRSARQLSPILSRLPHWAPSSDTSTERRKHLVLAVSRQAFPVGLAVADPSNPTTYAYEHALYVSFYTFTVACCSCRLAIPFSSPTSICHRDWALALILLLTCHLSFPLLPSHFSLSHALPDSL